MMAFAMYDASASVPVPTQNIHTHTHTHTHLCVEGLQGCVFSHQGHLPTRSMLLMPAELTTR